MSVEEKAREYVNERASELEVGVRVGDVRDAYLAGHAEALRWRDPVNEPPSEEGAYCVCRADQNGLTAGHPVTTRMYSGGRWRTELRVIGWRPIGPLPEAL